MCTASVHNTTQNSSDNLPSYLQTSIIAQMLSIGGEEDPLYIKAKLGFLMGRTSHREKPWQVKGEILIWCEIQDRQWT